MANWSIQRCISLYSDWFSRNAEIYGEEPSGIDKAKALMRDFVRLYRTICSIRNDANHSNNDIIIDSIKMKINELNIVLKTIKSQTPSGADHGFYITDQFNQTGTE